MKIRRHIIFIDKSSGFSCWCLYELCQDKDGIFWKCGSGRTHSKWVFSSYYIDTLIKQLAKDYPENIDPLVIESVFKLKVPYEDSHLQ